MKKIALFCAATLLAYGTQAQTTKGTVVITGKAGYYQHKGDTEKENETNHYDSNGYSYTVSPSIGIFLLENLEIGASINLNRNKSESHTSRFPFSNSTLSEAKEKGFGVYARQYKLLTERLAVHGTLSAGISNEENTLVYNDVNSYYPQTYTRRGENRGFDVGLSPGLTFFASDKVGLHASLGALTYSSYKAKRENVNTSLMHPPQSPERNDYSYKTNGLRLNFSSMYLNFGISYFIGK